MQISEMATPKRSLTDKISSTVIILVLAWVAWVVKPGVEDLWSRWRDFTDPQYSEYLSQKWAHKSTDFLIGKLQHPSIIYSGVATGILRGRKEPAQVDKILRIINKGGTERGRGLALSVLFFWDEKRAIDLSMGILKSGRDHPLFDSALGMLAYRKYEPAYPYVVELAKSSDRATNGADLFLEKYGKLESLPLLEEMLKSARTSLDKRSITNSIQSIKKQNGIIDQ